MGLAAVFYFVPKITERPLYSQYNGLLNFLFIVVFGSWGGVPHGSPFPAWMSALSTMGAVLMVVPILAVAINVRKTMTGGGRKVSECRPLKFFLFGGAAYVVAGLAGAAGSLMRVNKVTEFTWFVPAQTQLMVYGFFVVTMLGAIYYIVPRLLNVEFPKPPLICAEFYRWSPAWRS